MNDESATDSDNLAAHLDSVVAQSSVMFPKTRARLTACLSFVGKLKRFSKQRRHNDMDIMRNGVLSDDEHSTFGLDSSYDKNTDWNKNAEGEKSQQGQRDPSETSSSRLQQRQDASLRTSLPLSHVSPLSPLSPPPRQMKTKRATVDEIDFTVVQTGPSLPNPRNSLARRSLALRLSLDVEQYTISHSPSTLSVVTSGSDCTSRRHQDTDGPADSDNAVDDEDEEDDDTCSYHTLSRPRVRPTSMITMPFHLENLNHLKQRHQSYGISTSSAASATAPLSPCSPSSPLADEDKRVSLIERRRRRSPLNVPDGEQLKLALEAQYSSHRISNGDDEDSDDAGDEEDYDSLTRRFQLAISLSERDVHRLALLEREASREEAMCSLEGRRIRNQGVDVDKVQYEAIVTRTMQRQSSLSKDGRSVPLQRFNTDAPSTSRTPIKDTKSSEDPSSTGQGTALRTPSLIYFPSSPSSAGSMNDDIERRQNVSTTI